MTVLELKYTKFSQTIYFKQLHLLVLTQIYNLIATLTHLKINTCTICSYYPHLCLIIIKNFNKLLHIPQDLGQFFTM